MLQHCRNSGIKKMVAAKTKCIACIAAGMRQVTFLLSELQEEAKCEIVPCALIPGQSCYINKSLL